MWSTKELKAELNLRIENQSLRYWRIKESQLKKKEAYLIQEKDTDAIGVGLDQDRKIEESSIFVSIVVDKENQKQGTASQQVFPAQPLPSQIDRLIQSAGLAEEKHWEIPKPDKKSKVSVETCYSGAAKNLDKVTDGLLEDMNTAIASTDGGEFNSAEIFVNYEKTKYQTSNGFKNEVERSKIYSEVCFSHTNNKGQSEEFLLTGWNVHPEQFNYQSMCQNSAEYAQKSLETERPKAGEYSVILHPEVLSEVFSAALSHLDSRSKYYKMPFMEPDSDFVSDFKGAAFEMWLDPSEDYLVGSGAFDVWGQAQKPLLLVDNNKVVSSITTPQDAQYLEAPVTSSVGNVRIEPEKSVKFEKLTQAAPQVLEILQFSGLFTSPMTLTFSSEIRLARIYDNEKGEVRYIKGGSLSGNLLKNLKNCQWSKRRVRHNHCGWGNESRGYVGPAYGLFTDVSVTS